MSNGCKEEVITFRGWVSIYYHPNVWNEVYNTQIRLETVLGWLFVPHPKTAPLKMLNIGKYGTHTLRGAFSIFLSLRCQRNMYNTDFCRMYYFSSNKSPWWCTQSLSFSTSRTLRFMHLLSTPIIYWNTADLVFYRHWNNLPKRASSNFWNNKNSKGSRYKEYVVCCSSKLCVVVDSPVKIWPCTLSSNFMPFTTFWYHFDIKPEYYFDVDKSSKTLQFSRNEETCHFPILIETYRVHQHFVYEIS